MRQQRKPRPRIVKKSRPASYFLGRKPRPLPCPHCGEAAGLRLQFDFSIHSIASKEQQRAEDLLSEHATAYCTVCKLPFAVEVSASTNGIVRLRHDPAEDAEIQWKAKKREEEDPRLTADSGRIKKACIPLGNEASEPPAIEIPPLEKGYGPPPPPPGEPLWKPCRPIVPFGPLLKRLRDALWPFQ